MRDLIITQNITVDGVIDAAERWFAPAGEDRDTRDLEEALAEQRETADGFLVGRVTFEQMRDRRPPQIDDTSGVSAYLDRVRKYVVSTTLRDPEWEPTTVLRDLESVRDLKHETGRDIVCTGSLTLVPELIRAGLVDEYRLFTYPIVLGRGQRLFEGQTDVGDLEVVQTTPFRCGVVLTRYRAGA